MNANVYGLFHRRFSLHSAAACFETADGAILTYGELDRLSGQFAAYLQAAGAGTGDRVAVQVDKSIAAVALYLGVLRLGAVFVPLNTAYTPHEVEFFLKDARPLLFFCQPSMHAALESIAKDAGAARCIALSDRADDALVSAIGDLSPVNGTATVDEGDLAVILYTSGTTGRSKGAMLSHGNLASNALALNELWGFSPGDVLLHALPIFHIHGLFIALHTAFLSASKIVFLPKFDPAEIRRRLKGATVMMGVPTFYTRLLDDPAFSAADCATMRLFICGSAPLSARDSIRFKERTGCEILERYGMTEAGMIASNPLLGARVPGSGGFALPGVSVRVCDGEGKELPRGESGVIEVRGPNVFSGYRGLAERTAEEFRRDGFFITGDVGEMDADGRLRIVGRVKDLIISGGYNIYPREIEGVLDEIPGVAESAVIGAPHKDLGEGVVAILVAECDPLPDGVIQRALDERLARFKHPRRLIWEASLPRNAMGKVQKAALRKKYATAYERP
ncbi:MAG: AMP-binding protein [Parvularculaceae bacterium]